MADYKLGLHQDLGLRLEQRLILTQEMQQALQILQMQTMELAQWLQQEMQQNPVLEDGTLVEDDETIDDTPEADDGAETDSSEAEPAKTPDELPTVMKERDKEYTREESERTDIDWNRYDDGRDLGFVGNPPSREDQERPLENLISRSESLEEHLIDQLILAGLDKADEKAAIAIISEIDAGGFYRGNLDALARSFRLDPEHAKNLLKLIQTFDPNGVGARNLVECLQIQLHLAGEDDSWAYQIVTEHLDDIYHKRWKRISQKLGIKMASVQEAATLIAALHPQPGNLFDNSEIHYIIPDVIVRKIESQYEIIINDEHLPHLRISSRYQQIFNAKDTKESTKEYLKKKFNDAEWIIRSIYQRNNTIYRVAKTLVNLQYEFIEKGIAFLKPLTLQDVAERIEMSESTVSRVTSNKYIQIPRGIMRMRLFFSGGLPSADGGVTSSRSVHDMIRRMIEDEDRYKPLTDTQLLKNLKEQGVKIARRTVCKYREDLGILPAKMRRELKPANPSE